MSAVAPGASFEALQTGDCSVFGLEYADSALEYCKKRNLNVQKFDIERQILTDQRTYDVAISMEVAEHLPESRANRFVALLTSLSDQIVFTAAQPGQGGTDHVNEQPPSYWISKFQERGFELDQTLSDGWRESWTAGGVPIWYVRNLMIFRRRQVC